MIKARHNQLYIWFFRNFFGILAKIHFRKLIVVSDVNIRENQSVLLFQNHFSWWDGYWSYHLSWKVLDRRFYVMMFEEQLRKRLFLNRTGIFSIRRNNRDFLNSLQYSSEILTDPKNLVTIYPAGNMLTQHQQMIRFQRGIDRIVKGETEHFAIVLAVVLVDYFGFARPEARVYVKNYTEERTVEAIEKAYHLFYQSCISKQTE